MNDLKKISSESQKFYFLYRKSFKICIYLNCSVLKNNEVLKNIINLEYFTFLFISTLTLDNQWQCLELNCVNNEEQEIFLVDKVASKIVSSILLNLHDLTTEVNNLLILSL